MPVNVGVRHSMYVQTKPFYATANHLSSERNQEQPPFLRLPAELRNHIYKHAYGTTVVEANRSFIAHGSEYVIGNDGVIRRCPQPTVRRKMSGLSFVCRQIHQESAPLTDMYSCLEIQGTATFTMLMRLLCPRSSYLRAVREVQLSEDLMSYVLDLYGHFRASPRSAWRGDIDSCGEIFPVLEVIIWSCDNHLSALWRHVELQNREATARFCFCKPNLRLIDA
jgi:hypothetical protein